MKWSQGLCAAILIDGLYFPQPARVNPRWERDFPTPDPAATPNALKPDWSPLPAVGKQGPIRRRLPGFKP